RESSGALGRARPHRRRAAPWAPARDQGRLERRTRAARGARATTEGRMRVMPVADGLVVTLEYTVHLADGTLLDSTGRCGPIMVMVGSGHLFPALEDGIVGMEP